MDQEEEIQPGGPAGWAGYVVILAAIAVAAITIAASASGFAGAWATGAGITLAVLSLAAGVLLFILASRELGRDRIEAQRRAADKP